MTVIVTTSESTVVPTVSDTLKTVVYVPAAVSPGEYKNRDLDVPAGCPVIDVKVAPDGSPVALNTTA